VPGYEGSSWDGIGAPANTPPLIIEILSKEVNAALPDPAFKDRLAVLVGFAAGGPLDTSARLIAQWLSEHLGQPFIVENRPGAGSNLATEMVVRAPPDGYTLLEISASNAWNATLYDNLNFNFVRDIVPIAGVRRAAGVMEVNPSVPVTTVSEFIAYAKANPGKINMATGGMGSAQHLYQVHRPRRIIER
jgi:tripartite-type tricarboxylate transporter receptor subunit TctC